MKTFTCALLGLFMISSVAAPEGKAATGKQYTYVCMANLYKRWFQTDTDTDGNTFSQINLTIISSIVSHWDDAKSGGGGSIFDGNQMKENGDVVIDSARLKDEDGTEYEPIGMFDTAIGKSNLDVGFYSLKNHKLVGKELKIKGTRAQSTQIAPNKFITVSCTMVPKMKVKN